MHPIIEQLHELHQEMLQIRQDLQNVEEKIHTLVNHLQQEQLPLPDVRSPYGVRACAYGRSGMQPFQTQTPHPVHTQSGGGLLGAFASNTSFGHNDSYGTTSMNQGSAIPLPGRQSENTAYGRM